MVVVGYPEWCNVSGSLFNSQMAVGPCGGVLANHRKAHLYVEDKTWAQEGGRGFATVTLPRSGVLCALGICMDINPYEFKDYGQFELAQAAVAAGARCLLFSSAWCRLEEEVDEEDADEEGDDDELVAETVHYWLSRLRPFAAVGGVFVCADRVGREGQVPCRPLLSARQNAALRAEHCPNLCRAVARLNPERASVAVPVSFP